MKDYSHLEEPFESRKAHRKERKLAKNLDRSQFKKTDQEKKKEFAPPKEAVARGRVLTIASGGILVSCNGEQKISSLRGTLKQQRSEQKRLLTVGDFVWLDDRGQITAVEPRFSKLTRADTMGHKEQILAANVDQVLITVSAHDPEIKPALIDRYIIAAKKGNMKPVIVVNKIDLLPLPPVLDLLEKLYTAQGIPFVRTSSLQKTGLHALRQLMEGKVSVFSGQSGVGKTSLINALTGLDLKVGSLQKTEKGGHPLYRWHQRSTR